MRGRVSKFMSCLQTAVGRWVHPFCGSQKTNGQVILVWKSICKLTSEKSFGRVNKNYCILWYCLSEDDPEVKKDAKVGGVLSDGDAIPVDQLLERFSS